ncbi:phosphotransferase [Streptomyces avermitilis]
MHRLLKHLEDVGFDAAPRLLGTDAKGREILSFQHGENRTDFRAGDWSPAQITAAAQLLRRLHDATADTPIAGGEEAVCHNDFSPLNVAFVDGLPVSAFDFDQAAPGPRAHDLAYSAWLRLLGADIARPLDRQLALLRTFLDVYGFNDEYRRSFGGRMVARVEAERDMHDRAGRVTSPGSWLHDEIAWLSQHAAAIDRGLESSS